MPDNVQIMTRFRPDVGEFEKVRTHARRAYVATTLCGLNLMRVRVWENTSYPVDCLRCKKAVGRLNGEK